MVNLLCCQRAHGTEADTNACSGPKQRPGQDRGVDPRGRPFHRSWMTSDKQQVDQRMASALPTSHATVHQINTCSSSASTNSVSSLVIIINSAQNGPTMLPSDQQVALCGTHDEIGKRGKRVSRVVHHGLRTALRRIRLAGGISLCSTLQF